MIKLPINSLTAQENEELNIICNVLFIDVVDNRMISMIGEATLKERVGLLMENPLCEKLFDMLQIFGEDDFITFLKPVITKLANTDYLTEDYTEVFEKYAKEVI